MKTKLLKQIRKKYQIVYNPDEDCYLVRDKRCNIKKYEATSRYKDQSLKWYGSIAYLHHIELNHKRYAFYWMLANLGYNDILLDHVEHVCKRQEKRETIKLKKEFSKCYHNKL